MMFPALLRRAVQAAGFSIALALLTGSAFAQQATPADSDFTESHLRAAQQVIDLTQSDRTFDDILPRLATQTLGIFTRSNPALTRELETTVFDVALAMAGRRTELSRTLQLIWARRFTEAELGELVSFFNTTVGSKFVETSPLITALSVGAARQWEEAMSSAMVSETRRSMREQGYSL